MGDDRQTRHSPDALIEAICKHDATALEAAIASAGEELNLNQPDKQGITPLLWAVRESQANAVERLLTAGADPNIGLRADYSPLPLSIILKEYAIATLLLKSPRLNLASQGFVAATEAVIGRDVEGLMCLARNGFDFQKAVPPNSGITTEQNRATSLLFFSLSVGLPKSEVIRYLLKVGADPEAISNGRTFLTVLCSKTTQYEEEIKTLLDGGASPNRLDQAGYGPLHYAAAHDHVEIVNLLLAYGTPSDQLAVDGSFPLLWAAGSHGQSVHARLREACDANQLDRAKKTAQKLSSQWRWNAEAEHWCVLSLDPNDGAWNAITWGNDAKSVEASLARKFASSRGISSPCIVLYLQTLSKKSIPPAPWLPPGRKGRIKIGQTMNLYYYAPFFPAGIPKEWPTETTYRFILTEQTDDGNLAEDQVVLISEIVNIVRYEEGWLANLPGVECVFDGQNWNVLPI